MKHHTGGLVSEVVLW